MAAFTIFENKENGNLAAVWDHQLPTQTGIGELEKWVPVYHGDATGFKDKIRQRTEFALRRGKA